MVKEVLNEVTNGLRESSPKLMIAIGVVGMTVAGVYACVETHRKLGKVLDESREEIDKIHEAKELVDNDENTEVVYTKTDYRRDLCGAYGRRTLKIMNVYKWPALIALVSAAFIFKGENILIDRLAETTAAFNALQISHNQLKKAVDDNFGEGTAEKLVMGGSLEKKPKLDNAKWEYNGEPNDIYAFSFDQTNLEWVDNRELLYHKLAAMQQAMNDCMVARLKTGSFDTIERPGYYFLREALTDLCIEPADEGKVHLAQNAGWIFDPKNPIGDNFIDIGLDNPINQSFFFESGTVPSDMKFRQDPIESGNDKLYLVFNCDGLIGQYLNPNSRFHLNLKADRIEVKEF